MALERYNRIIFGDRTSKESYLPSGRYFNYLVDYINNFGGDGIIIFQNSTEREAYLYNPDAKPGQIASDLTDTTKIYVISSNGQLWQEVGTGEATEPGGNNTQLQFNDDGTFGGSGVTWDKGSSIFTVDGMAKYPTPISITNASQFTHKTYVDSLLNSVVILKDNWDADTNAPDITEISTTGWAYVVSVEGETDLGGITDWEVGDWAVKADGEDKWLKIPGASVNLEWGTIGGTLSAQTDLNSALNLRPTRNYVNPTVSVEAILTFDFDSLNECYATKSGGGSIVVDADIEIAYDNDTNFKTLAAFIQVTNDTRVITFPANHISGDYRWALLTLTLPIGFYQISAMYDGSKYHVLCSEVEV